jgi:hypothetical protein
MYQIRYKSKLWLFQLFLALFDIFTTRYSHSDIKFEFSDQFQYIEHIISKRFLKMY